MVSQTKIWTKGFIGRHDDFNGELCVGIRETKTFGLAGDMKEIPIGNRKPPTQEAIKMSVSEIRNCTIVETVACDTVCKKSGKVMGFAGFDVQ